MVGFSVYEGKLETSIEKGQEEEGSVSMGERESERGKGSINRVKGGRGRKQKERWRRRLLRQTLARVLNYACNTLNYFNLRARAFFSSILARERDYATLNS